MKRFLHFTQCALLLLGSVCAQAPALPEFSSDLVTASANGTEQMQGKMYFRHGKTRMDINSHGHNMSIISDGPAKTSYMIMPEQHMYMEMRGDVPNPNPNPMSRRGSGVPNVKQFAENPCVNDSSVTCKKVGTETVNGRSCDKWEFISKSDNKVTQRIWVDQKTHMPIRIVGADGNTTDFKNFKEGPQDPSLFEVPPGFQKMDLGSMMGGRPPDKN